LVSERNTEDVRLTGSNRKIWLAGMNEYNNPLPSHAGPSVVPP
jgi:hypothetical protein